MVPSGKALNKRAQFYLWAHSGRKEHLWKLSSERYTHENTHVKPFNTNNCDRKKCFLK